MNLDEIKELLFKLIHKKGTITIEDPDYSLMHQSINCFIYENNFDNSDEWRIISKNLIYTLKEYFSFEEANIILKQLELLRRKVLKEEQLSRNDKNFLNSLHPLIFKVVERPYLNKEYATAIENAFKEIDHRLIVMYKKHKNVDENGVSLMRDIFNYENKNNQRLLIFEDINYESGKNVQQGYMQIFAGAMQAIRNPKAHENMTATKESAIDRLIFASMLMKKIDEAIKFTGITE